MSVRWDDVNARVRGLSGRLLGRARLRTLAQSRDLEELARGLEAVGYGPYPGTPLTAPGLDLALRRGAASRIRILARWSGERARALAPLFEDEDRRSLRALLRGALAGTSAQERLAWVIPTPGLPERALEELAAQPTASGVVTLLLAWGNPYGAPLWVEARRPKPDAFKLELLLHREYFSRALRAARAAGPELVLHVRDEIDLANAASALLLAGEAEPGRPIEESFLPGGRWLSPSALQEATSATDVEEAASRLIEAFALSPYAAVFRRPRRDWSAIDDAVLRIQTARHLRASRRSPLGVSLVIAYWLRLRAEIRDLRRLMWGIGLGAPPSARAETLVSV